MAGLGVEFCNLAAISPMRLEMTTSPNQEASMADRVTTKAAAEPNAPARAGLSAPSRWLTRVLALVYLLVGLVMFAFPDWSAHHFAWKVSPFVAITLGSYLLGNAWIAAVVQHTSTASSVYSALLYLWLFGVLETAVVLI